MSLHYFFFFSSRRRHTRLQGDWSSDVCSSDLNRERSAVGGETMPHAPARAGHATRARHPPGRARQSTAACAAPRPQCEDPEKETMALTLRPGYRAAGNRPKRVMAGMGWETWKRLPHEWGRPRGHPAWKATLRFAFGRYQDQPNARRTTIVLPGCGRDH